MSVKVGLGTSTDGSLARWRITAPLFGRRSFRRMLEREDAGYGRPMSHVGIERHGTTMKLDERAHDRETETGAAMTRAECMGFEAIEHAVLDLRRNAGTT